MIKTRTASLFALALGALAVPVLAQSTPAPAPGGDRPDPARSVTRAEAQQRAEQMFARMDANKDGKLDEADRTAHEAARFAEMDSNKDGALSPAELSAGHGRHHDGMGGEDGMGPEGGRMGPGGRGGHDGPGGRMGRMADANGDGAVSREEFLATSGKRFDMADADKDGTITAAERKAMHEKMRGMMSGRGKGRRGGAGE